MYDRFAALLEEKNLRAADVTKATGIKSTVFSEWKKGKSSPNADKLVKIAQYLNTSVEYLVTGTETAAAAHPISDFEYEIIKAYRRMEASAQDVILTALHLVRPTGKTERGMAVS